MVLLRRLVSVPVRTAFGVALTRMMSSGRPSVAVVLSGCGVYDGSEVHEASACIEGQKQLKVSLPRGNNVMVHLSRQSADYQIYAPDIPQMHTINHTNGQEMENSPRNVFVESARIARGKIQALSELDASKHDAVVFPGGFGAAKNLCDFAVKQAECKVDEDVAKTLKAFHSAKKPIGLCCIAPVLAAKVITGCEVTMGQEQEEEGRWPYAGATGAVKAMGSKHIPKNVNEAHVDAENKIVTTPAFMCETKVHEIHDGVGEMIKGVLKLV